MALGEFNHSPARGRLPGAFSHARDELAECISIGYRHGDELFEIRPGENPGEDQ